MNSESRPVRRGDIVWRHETRREQELLEAQERGEDISDMGTVILVADGAMHQLNLLGGEIWRRCDGTATVGEIVRALAGEYDVDAAELDADVREFLTDLQQRGWIDYA
ncbi:MAG: pyrroloquinoline quinone biosynthesis peptide chaperone PqqD [Deltaproteobacteria bacterium]|nr:MAG: pyrroloquinoline quinone biosynthesis peptide chaperone PqqD [Deltaproteobacteria bacterium]